MNFNFINLKFNICLGLMILSFFGFNKIVVHADSFKTIQNWSFCSFNTLGFDNQGCILYNSDKISDYASINGFTNVTKVFTSYFPSNKRGTETHSEFYKYGGTTGCSTGNTISFNLDIIMNDVQELLPNNTLNYDAWQSATPTVRGGLLNSSNIAWNNYYSWLSNSSSTDSQNKLGVAVAKNDYNYNYTQCSFISYGSNKSLRYRCNIPSGNTGYYIRLNFGNLTGVILNGYSNNTSLPLIVSGIKITMLNDPCLSYSNDQTGVIHAITDQTSDIMQGFQDIIDNNNSNTNSTNSAINDWGNNMASKQDITNSKLNDLQSAILNSDTSSSNGLLNNFTSSYNYAEGLQDIFEFPLHILNNLDFENNICQPMYFNISGFTRHFWNFDYTFTLPCINLKNILGNDFYNLVDMFIAFGLFFGFVGHLYLRVHDVISGNNGFASDMAEFANRSDGEGDWVTKRYNKRTGEIK